MTRDSQSDLADWSARMRAQTEYAGERGEQWVKHYEEFKQLPAGTIVVINCRTGEYLIAETRRAATDEFERRFGKETGYLIEIGGRAFVGGGFG